MLSSIADKIRLENAKFSRDVEYLKEIANDDIVDDRLSVAEESVFGPETVEEREEALDLVNRTSAEDDPIEEAEEVERILNAESDLTFMEMAGLD